MDRMEVKFASDGVDAKTGVFTGYGAVFGNLDSHGDVIVPGAFKATLADWERRGSLPAMKLMHGTAINPFSGSDLPIGKWTTMREDHKGLYVEGKISGIGTATGDYIYSLMNDGALDALSVGYKTIRFARGSGAPVKRQLEELKLFEVSLLPEGSNPEARVTSVKSAEEIKTIREFEDFLRDVGGYSHAAAKAIALHGFKASDPRDEDGADIAAIIRRNINTLRG